jgi:hypothetical protein
MISGYQSCVSTDEAFEKYDIIKELKKVKNSLFCCRTPLFFIGIKSGRNRYG